MAKALKSTGVEIMVATNTSDKVFVWGQGHEFYCTPLPCILLPCSWADPIKKGKNPGNGTFYVKLYILWECNWENTQHWFYVKLVYSSWATGCKKCCLERNGKTFPFSANFMFGNRQEKVIKSLVQKTWKYLVQTSCLEMGRTNVI